MPRATPLLPSTSDAVTHRLRWLRRARVALHRGLARLGGALARAERRITENFRVPPHGG